MGAAAASRRRSLRHGRWQAKRSCPSSDGAMASSDCYRRPATVIAVATTAPTVPALRGLVLSARAALKPHRQRVEYSRDGREPRLPCVRAPPRARGGSVRAGHLPGRVRRFVGGAQRTGLPSPVGQLDRELRDAGARARLLRARHRRRAAAGRGGVAGARDVVLHSRQRDLCGLDAVSVRPARAVPFGSGVPRGLPVHRCGGDLPRPARRRLVRQVAVVRWRARRRRGRDGGLAGTEPRLLRHPGRLRLGGRRRRVSDR